MIPCANPRAQYLAYRQEIEAAIAQGPRRGGATSSDRRSGRSRRIRIVRRRGARRSASGTGPTPSALALAACGIGPGDEVITVSHTAVATVAAIEMAGATPVFADIEPRYFTDGSGRDGDRADSPRTKAIVPCISTDSRRTSTPSWGSPGAAA